MILSILENGKIRKIDCDSPSFCYTCDVLCIGAGAAGIYAADSAARLGAGVILCEIGENIGGMHVCGNVISYYYGASGGSFEEDDTVSDNDTVFMQNRHQPEQRQIHLMERLKRSGVKLLCRHSPIGLYMEGDRVVGALFSCDDQFISVRSSIIIDATSDGHLLRMTDVKKEYGKKSDGKFVPFGIFTNYVKNGVLKHKNNDSGIMNHYDLEDFSSKTVYAHSYVDGILTDGDMLNLSLYTGVREGLTFEGEESLSYEDILLGNRPSKVLFYAYSDLDRHGSERATEEETFRNWWVASNLATVVPSIPVPLGAVVPKGLGGLVTAGRCISTDTYAQSAVRMNRDMFRMGECVGIGAALAVKDGVDFLDIDYERFLLEANSRGCFSGCADHDFCFDNSYGRYLEKMRSLGREPDEKYKGMPKNASIIEPIEFDFDRNFHLLKTDAPGVAIWSGYVAKDRDSVREKLYSAMTHADDNLYRYNCAIALGLIRDTRAIPVLGEIVERRDCFFFTDNRRSNQFRSAVAVCLLGDIGGCDELPLLFDILKGDEIERPMYHTLKPNYLYHNSEDRNFVYFHMLTHTCMSIYRIYSRLGLDMAELHSFYKELFAADTVLLRVTNGTTCGTAYEETSGFISYLLDITGR